MMKSEPPPALSIVVTVYNEESNIVSLLDELERQAAALTGSYEILYIDDGSHDDTWTILKQEQSRRPYLRALRHRANFGQSAAQATGMAQARGSVVVTMDGDGQNDPVDLPRLVAALGEGWDCVCGVRRQRQDSLSKRIASRVANAARRMLTGDPTTDAGCAYRAFRRQALDERWVFNGMHRFLPAILRLQGYRVGELEIGHRPRVAGVSKYGVFDRLWRGLVDCLVLRWYRKRAVRHDRLDADA